MSPEVFRYNRFSAQTKVYENSGFVERKNRKLHFSCHDAFCILCSYLQKKFYFLFKALKEAYLTHHFHCCAFKYPEQHDPKKHALMEDSLRKLCPEETATTTSYDTGQFFEPHVKMRKKRNAKHIDDSDNGWWNSAFE